MKVILIVMFDFFSFYATIYNFCAFLVRLIVFYDTNRDFDNKNIRIAGFNFKIYELMIIILALE